MDASFGGYFARRRRELGLTLREFCAQHGFDPGNISKLERGKLLPPQSQEVLEKYARALQIEGASDEWQEFVDRAAAARGEIPRDLMSEEEVVSKLPVLFRTLRGDRVEEEDLRRLIDLIRRA